MPTPEQQHQFNMMNPEFQKQKDVLNDMFNMPPLPESEISEIQRAYGNIGRLQKICYAADRYIKAHYYNSKERDELEKLVNEYMKSNETTITTGPSSNPDKTDL